MSEARKAEELFSDAEKAEAEHDFHTAYRLFTQAYEAWALEEGEHADGQRLSLFRASLCLERCPDWRANAATWELLGDELGESLADRYVKRTSPGQSGMFNIISIDQWENPYNGYYEGSPPYELTRHQQAWGYLFAARISEQESDFDQAVRAYRKSAMAWELSEWGESSHQEVRPSHMPTSRTELHVDSSVGAKWKLAARCYFRAAYCAVRSQEPRVADRLFEAYPLREVRIVSLNVGSGPSRVTDSASDLDRMQRCWSAVVDACATSPEEAVRVRSIVAGMHSQELQILEQALATSGRRRDAKVIHRRRQRILAEGESRKTRRVLRWVFLMTTGAGTSVLSTLATALIVYSIVFPLLFISFGLISRSDGSNLTAAEAIIYSLANVVTLDVANVTTVSYVAEGLRVTQALSAYFVLGYVLWLSVRWYGE